jgi:alkylhydroperoxidase/carboxymuconolactone decarboxylase family protein YurZ
MGGFGPVFPGDYLAHDETVGARSVHLPPEFKELITVAALTIEREEYGLPFHINRAFRVGATKEEIMETLQAASFHSGALTLVHGLKALMEVIEEAEKGRKEG